MLTLKGRRLRNTTVTVSPACTRRTGPAAGSVGQDGLAVVWLQAGLTGCGPAGGDSAHACKRPCMHHVCMHADGHAHMLPDAGAQH